MGYDWDHSSFPGTTKAVKKYFAKKKLKLFQSPIKFGTLLSNFSAVKKNIKYFFIRLDQKLIISIRDSSFFRKN